MGKKKIKFFIGIGLFLIVSIAVAMGSWEFRVWVCEVTQKSICVEVFPPPPHIQEKHAEIGKETGVNF